MNPNDSKMQMRKVTPATWTGVLKIVLVKSNELDARPLAENETAPAGAVILKAGKKIAVSHYFGTADQATATHFYGTVAVGWDADTEEPINESVRVPVATVEKPVKVQIRAAVQATQVELLPHQRKAEEAKAAWRASLKKYNPVTGEGEIEAKIAFLRAHQENAECLLKEIARFNETGTFEALDAVYSAGFAHYNIDKAAIDAPLAVNEFSANKLAELRSPKPQGAPVAVEAPPAPAAAQAPVDATPTQPETNGHSAEPMPAAAAPVDQAPAAQETTETAAPKRKK